jgi:hypothetical protein
MKPLSKSKLLAFRQCPKRLWLEVHQPELRADSDATQASFVTGHAVGAIARSLYDPHGTGTELDLGSLGMAALLEKTQKLLEQRKPIFEAGFVGGAPNRKALALADILLPDSGRSKSWRMIEVKSSGSVKDYHRDDVAIQHYVASQAGVTLSGAALAHINTSWTYSGGNDYTGLLVESDLSEEAASRRGEVEAWISAAHKVVAKPSPPDLGPGAHCSKPFDCGFLGHCNAQDEAIHGNVEHPVHWLPRIQTKALKEYIESSNVRSLADVPDDLLNATQLKVKRHTLSGKTFFNGTAAAKALSDHKLPALFLDFETIAYAVPIWAGTRPYQQVPFQFSLHRLYRTGRSEHSGFLDLTGRDPSEPFARELVDTCSGGEPIFVYNKGFEGARIKDLAERYPRLSKKLLALEARLVDLLPVAQAHFYHPSQQGSWSIKAVLPAVAPELRYDNLEGVQDGGAAQLAFLEAAQSETTVTRRQEIRQQLWRYCRLDTFAMVRLWAHLAGRTDFVSHADDAPDLSTSA